MERQPSAVPVPFTSMAGIHTLLAAYASLGTLTPRWLVLVGLCGSACTDLRAVFRHVVLREDVRPAWKWFAHVRTAAAMSPCHTRVTRMLPVLVSRALLPLSGAARAGRGSRLVHCQPGTPHCVLSQGCTHSRVGIHVVWYDGYPPCWWWQSPEAREQLANPKLPVTLCVTDPFLTPKGAQKLQWITLTTENTTASGGQDQVPHNRASAIRTTTKWSHHGVWVVPCVRSRPRSRTRLRCGRNACRTCV